MGIRGINMNRKGHSRLTLESVPINSHLKTPQRPDSPWAFPVITFYDFDHQSQPRPFGAHGLRVLTVSLRLENGLCQL